MIRLPIPALSAEASIFGYDLGLERNADFTAIRWRKMDTHKGFSS